jgi:hypothetical protein
MQVTLLPLKSTQPLKHTTMKVFKPYDDDRIIPPYMVIDNLVDFSYDVNLDGSDFNILLKRSLPDFMLFRIFLTGIFKGLRPNATNAVPISYSSLIMYDKVFSKFVMPRSSTPRAIPYTGQSPFPAFTLTTVDPTMVVLDTDYKTTLNKYYGIYESPNGSYGVAIDGSGQGQPDIDGEYFIYPIIPGPPPPAPPATFFSVPSPLHQGILLDGCHIMAMMKVRFAMYRDLKTMREGRPDADPVMSLKDLYDLTINVDDTPTPKEKRLMLSPITINILDVYRNTGVIDKDMETTVVKDDDYKVTVGVETDRYFLTNLFNPDNLFAEKTLNVSIRETIERVYNICNGRNISAANLKNVLDSLSARYDEMILNLTLQFYNKLGGSVEDVKTKSMIMGDGSNTIGLLRRKNEGISMFSYDYEVKRSTVETKNNKTYKIDLQNTGVGVERVLHFDVFAVDDSDGFDVLVTPFRGSTELSSSYLLTNYKGYGIGSITSGISPVDLNPKSWIENGTNKILGFYVNETADLVIQDETITSVRVILAQKGNINTATGAIVRQSNDDDPEIIVTVSSFKDQKLSAIDLELEASDLFDRDKFEVDLAHKSSMFWSTSDVKGRENLDLLIELIKDGYTLETEMKGNFIGMLRIPPQFDDDITYQIGEYVLHKDQLYICTAINNTDAPGVGGWITPVLGAVTYDFNTIEIPHFIFHGNTIYRLKKKYTSTTTTFDPVAQAANWEKVASVYDKTQKYEIGDKIVYKDELYEALSVIEENSNYNEKKWKHISRVMQDPRYLPFSKTAYGLTASPADEPLKDEFTGTQSPLQQNLYKLLKYSFLEVSVDYSNRKIKFIIDSYASPDRSGLGGRYTGGGTTDDYRGNNAFNISRFNNLKNNHTLLGRNGSLTAFSFSGGLASYNQVLSALRCFGVLEAMVCRIKFIANNSAVDTALNDLLADPNTRVATADSYDSGGNPTNSPNFIVYGTGTSPTDSNEYVDYKWYTQSDEDTDRYSDTCAD